MDSRFRGRQQCPNNCNPCPALGGSRGTSTIGGYRHPNTNMYSTMISGRDPPQSRAPGNISGFSNVSSIPSPNRRFQDGISSRNVQRMQDGNSYSEIRSRSISPNFGKGVKSSNPNDARRSMPTGNARMSSGIPAPKNLRQSKLRPPTQRPASACQATPSCYLSKGTPCGNTLNPEKIATVQETALRMIQPASQMASAGLLPNPKTNSARIGRISPAGRDASTSPEAKKYSKTPKKNVQEESKVIAIPLFPEDSMTGPMKKRQPCPPSPKPPSGKSLSPPPPIKPRPCPSLTSRPPSSRPSPPLSTPCPPCPPPCPPPCQAQQTKSPTKSKPSTPSKEPTVAIPVAVPPGCPARTIQVPCTVAQSPLDAIVSVPAPSSCSDTPVAELIDVIESEEDSEKRRSEHQERIKTLLSMMRANVKSSEVRETCAVKKNLAEMQDFRRKYIYDGLRFPDSNEREFTEAALEALATPLVEEETPPDYMFWKTLKKDAMEAFRCAKFAEAAQDDCDIIEDETPPEHMFWKQLQADAWGTSKMVRDSDPLKEWIRDPCSDVSPSPPSFDDDCESYSQTQINCQSDMDEDLIQLYQCYGPYSEELFQLVKL